MRCKAALFAYDLSFLITDYDRPLLKKFLLLVREFLKTPAFKRTDGTTGELLTLSHGIAVFFLQIYEFIRI